MILSNETFCVSDSVCLWNCVSVDLCVCESVYLLICVFVYLCVYRSVYMCLCTDLWICVPVCMCMRIYGSVCLRV